MRPLTLLLKLTIAATLVGLTESAPTRADENDRKACPEGWFKAGAQKDQYEVGVDHAMKRSGEAAAYLRPSVAEPAKDSFGTLMQTFQADAYRGKRVRMSAYVKSEKVEGWAGLWMRVDGATSTLLAFDNMQNRPIRGTADWTRHDIVLDVPEGGVAIAFGILLDGNGKVWVDDFSFEAVGKEIPVTELGARSIGPKEPHNLDFDKKR